MVFWKKSKILEKIWFEVSSYFKNGGSELFGFFALDYSSKYA